jgi:hypothetical protein
MSKRVIVVKNNKKATRKPRTPRLPFETGVPVNVKVEGRRTLLKGVTLLPVDGRTGTVKVLTGQRGRPSLLTVDQIQRVRVL